MEQGAYKDASIMALGHDGFIVDFGVDGTRIAFDPYEIGKEYELVDLVFVSHGHFDHCDPQSISKLIKKDSKIIAPKCAEKELRQFREQLEIVDDKEKHQAGSVTYWTIPAYNINKFRSPTEVFHPKEMGGVGFVVEVGKTRIYHAGDTDFIPEMEALKKVDLAFLPISGTYVMTLEEAIQATEVINPDVVVPMHFGKLLGSSVDAYRFQTLLKDKVKTLVLTVN